MPDKLYTSVRADSLTHEQIAAGVVYYRFPEAKGAGERSSHHDCRVTQRSLPVPGFHKAEGFILQLETPGVWAQVKPADRLYLKAEPAAARGFHHLKAAWYGDQPDQYDGYADEIEFGMDYPDGSAARGALILRWYTIGGNDVPQLQAFDDAFPLLAAFADVLAALANCDDANLTPLQFCDLLRLHGFTDLTHTTRGE